VQVIPAIDLKNGKCVRLREGKMNEETIFSTSPLEVAGSWFSQGAEWLHIVDLDGAFQGSPKNRTIIQEIVTKYKDLSIQIGGGIRTLDVAKSYLEHGASRIVIGTHAVKKPEFVFDLCTKFPDQIILGIDSKDGYVKTDGWLGSSNITPKDLLKTYEGLPISAVIFTDISRDGMMAGLNIEATLELAKNTSFPIIASGGISSIEEIQKIALASNLAGQARISGVICGRSLYEGSFSFSEAMKSIEEFQ